MKKLMFVLLFALPVVSHAQTFNRVGDVLTGVVVSTPVALATHKPVLGLLAGLAVAGIDDGYKMHDSTIRMSGGNAAYHISLMGAGSLIGYGIGRWENRLERKHRKQDDAYWWKR